MSAEQPQSAPFDPQELAQLRRFALLPFADKVRWLEAAHRLVLQLGAREAPPLAAPPDAPPKA